MMMDFLQSEWVQKLRKLFPAASFFGGFAWDSFTLGKLVQTSDLAILLLYYLASLILLILLNHLKMLKPFFSHGCAELGGGLNLSCRT